MANKPRNSIIAVVAFWGFAFLFAERYFRYDFLPEGSVVLRFDRANGFVTALAPDHPNVPVGDIEKRASEHAIYLAQKSEDLGEETNWTIFKEALSSSKLGEVKISEWRAIKVAPGVFFVEFKFGDEEKGMLQFAWEVIPGSGSSRVVKDSESLKLAYGKYLIEPKDSDSQ